jgi:tRNA modification GTPase
MRQHGRLIQAVSLLKTSTARPYYTSLRTPIIFLHRISTASKWRSPTSTTPNQTPLSDETIIALSTPPGRSAIAVLRISGPASLSIHNRLCPQSPAPRARHATLRTLFDPLSTTNTPLDKCIVLYFPAQRALTGQDTLELHLHGSPATVRAVLRVVASLSAPDAKVRFAEPGEFTRRAVLNGRLDLTQAEALGELLTADTETQRLRAQRGAAGDLARRYESWRSMLIAARGEMEALIDFAEEEQFAESPAELVRNVTNQVTHLNARIAVHIENAKRGELVRSGINVALLGQPNVGKSSLLNLIVGREAAIVSPEAGTTRDVLGVIVDLGGYAVRLEDLAGVRGFSDGVGAIEKEGIRRARDRVGEADVIILLFAFHMKAHGRLTIDVDDEILTIAQQAIENGSKIVIAVNKSDLIATKPSGDTLEEHIGRLSARLGSFKLEGCPIVPFSCHNAVNPDPEISNLAKLPNLLSSLINQFHIITKPAKYQLPAATSPQTPCESLSDIIHQNESSIENMTEGNLSTEWSSSLSATERQRHLLVETNSHLEAYTLLVSDPAESGLGAESGMPAFHLDVVLAAEELRAAADCLARITGRGEAGDVEDVLGVVFEK